jgi:hypothetical protein
VTVTNCGSVSPDAASQTGAANASVSGASANNAASTTTHQVISLGAGGSVIVNLDTGITITYVYVVPTTAVYSGQTLTLGGPAGTITSAADNFLVLRMSA